MNNKSRWYVLGMIIFATGISSCRTSRSTRYASRRAQPPAAQATTNTPSAQSVLTHADSALARVSQLSADDVPADVPPHARFPERRSDVRPMRTPWGAPYTPRPNLTNYGLYEAALGAYNGQRYDEALALFSQVVTKGRPPELVPNAYYWMGESYYAMGNYAECMPYFEYVTRVGPSYKQTISLYKLARAALFLGNHQQANMYYERLRNEFPRSMYIRPLIKLGAR